MTTPREIRIGALANVDEFRIGAPTNEDANADRNVDEIYIGSALVWERYRPPIIDTFDASGTWTKRDGVTRLVIYGLHGGGGGDGFDLRDGHGGQGAGSYKKEISGAAFAALPASAPVVIGAGGIGGTISRKAGTDGGLTLFNNDTTNVGTSYRNFSRLGGGYRGGSGGGHSGGDPFGRGGGGAAGRDGDGGNANFRTGGSAGMNSIGGDGGNNSPAITAGGIGAGGGSGGSGQNGANGGNGRMIVENHFD